MRASWYRSRPVKTAVLGLCILAWAPQLWAESAGGKVLRTIAQWSLAQIPAYMAGKAIDLAAGKSYKQDLEKEIPRLVDSISKTTGPRRAVLKENLEIHRQQLVVLTQLVDPQGKRIEAVQAEQERLLQRIQSLEPRLAELERRVDQLDTRMDEMDSRLRQVEDALIHECLDLRHAEVLGEDEYRVQERPGGWSADHFESENLTLDLRLLLNSCSADLTRRGLVIQLSLVTRDLDKDLSLYVNWKGVGEGGYTLGAPRVLDRQEIPLTRPSYRVDGQVVELFFPYAEIPGFGSTDRIALALVLTHDGTVLYSLPDRVISCTFGQRVQCRWGR